MGEFTKETFDLKYDTTVKIEKMVRRPLRSKKYWENIMGMKKCRETKLNLKKLTKKPL